MNKDNIVIYQAKDGAIELQADYKEDTIWANINEIAELFNIDKSNVSRHIENIFEDKDIAKDSTVVKLATVEKHEGKRIISRQIGYYSLDIILAIGYRVRSAKKAIEFRKWATQVLKQHITKGFTINPKRIEENYQQFLQAVEDIKQLSANSSQVGTDDVLELVKTFSQTWFSLESYDKQKFPVKGFIKKDLKIQADDLYQAIAELKARLMQKKEATELFA